MTFWERYQKAEFWYERVILMELYHLARTKADKNWTIAMTARDFGGLSTSLVSENLKIAEAMHTNDKLINCKSRAEALAKLR